MSKYDIRQFDVLDSTNLEARRVMENNSAADKIVIIAKSQSNGRGRYGRDWISPPGNLYLSMLRKIDFDFELAPQLSFVTAIAARNSIGKSAKFKWPNDILINGKKVGGILLESAGKPASHIIIGVGINNLNYPDNMEFPASSLSANNMENSTDKLLQDFLYNFDALHDKWISDGFSIILNDWLSSAEGLGREITARTLRGNFVGIFRNITSKGDLEIELAGGEKKLIQAADVFL